MARPQKPINAETVRKLARASLSVAEMASILECHPRTLQRRYAAAMEKGRLSGDASLRRKQFQLAMKGDRVMLIWLGKVRLGQREHIDLAHTHAAQVPVDVTVLQAAIAAGRAAEEAATIAARQNGNGQAKGANGHA